MMDEEPTDDALSQAALDFVIEKFKEGPWPKRIDVNHEERTIAFYLPVRSTDPVDELWGSQRFQACILLAYRYDADGKVDFEVCQRGEEADTFRMPDEPE